ncbi:DUF3888 domain-containing protein [Bacillus salipaludis]|uniref:DUF3888 domain-containing protein n=1 Tax=Bacillus salipaludis TaxID=2547811 RepID=A0A4V3ATV9_9BACI|nr:DUF3888 domain-containing protein [Bacillus salipaludis]TDK61763.1 DUF3888 domain-containing protein [Bacillus salipaludis]
MKRYIIIGMSMLMLSSSLFFKEARAYNRDSKDFPQFSQSSKDNHQLYGYFFLDLFQDEIFQSIKEYYNDSTINGYATPWWQKYDMVRITQGNSHKDIKGFSYVLKITLLPSNGNGKIFGTDTLYFAVEPMRINKQNLPKNLPAIKLIKYDHKEAPTKK